jgi:hypothetical protein
MSTRPKLYLVHLLDASSVNMSIHTEGEPCSDLGRVVVLNDPSARC